MNPFWWGTTGTATVIDVGDRWLSRVAGRGEVQAQDILGAWYWFGLEPVAPDSEAAIR